MTTNNDDTQKEALGITLKDIKNNGLESKNTVEEITPLHPQTNNDDIHNKLKNNENFNISEGNVKEDNNFCNEKREENDTFCKENVKKSHNGQTLTEQWKKGELEQGYYYTRYTPSVGKPFVEIELRNYLIDLAKIRDAETVEVLAPVPSWEEYLECESHCAVYSDINKWLKEENDKFKELLKECYKMLAQYHIENSEPTLGENIQLLTKIDEVLK